MRKPRINWKQKCEEAEGALRNCQRACQSLTIESTASAIEANDWKTQWETAEDELQDRPEVVVTRTVPVVPWWAWTGCVMALALLYALMTLSAQVRLLEKPTPRPYPVTIVKNIGIKVPDVTPLIKRASAAIENGHPGKADRLLHEAVVEMQR